MHDLLSPTPLNLQSIMPETCNVEHSKSKITSDAFSKIILWHLLARTVIFAASKNKDLGLLNLAGWSEVVDEKPLLEERAE